MRKLTITIYERILLIPLGILVNIINYPAPTSHPLHVAVKCLLGNVAKLRYDLSMKSGGAKERNKMASGAGGMGNAGGKVDDWQRMLVERPRTAAEKRKGLKCVESGGEGEVGLGGGEEKEERN